MIFAIAAALLTAVLLYMLLFESACFAGNTGKTHGRN